MRSKIRRLGIGVVLAVVIILTVAAVPSPDIGETRIIGTNGLALSAYELPAIPQSVAEDATRLATELYGNYREKCNDFVSQLLVIYSEAETKDFVVIFNSGGWGYKPIEHYPGGWSILAGIESKLNNLGYTSLLLMHLRTVESWRGCLNELLGKITSYSSKAEDLVGRVEFLTNHIPDLKVIIAGESTGTVICDRAMNILQDNPRVYSIQVGPPFWYKNTILDRTIVLTSNGIISDSYSQGNLLAVLWGNLKSWFGQSEPIDDFGTPTHYVGAPGHDYWWQYPAVSSQITNFLHENFGIKG